MPAAKAAVVVDIRMRRPEPDTRLGISWRYFKEMDAIILEDVVPGGIGHNAGLRDGMKLVELFGTRLQVRVAEDVAIMLKGATEITFGVEMEAPIGEPLETGSPNARRGYRP